jgi:hypothetical protein
MFRYVAQLLSIHFMHDVLLAHLVIVAREDGRCATRTLAAFGHGNLLRSLGTSLIRGRWRRWRLRGWRRWWWRWWWCGSTAE